MKISQTRAEGLNREYAIVIPASEIQKHVAKRLEELARDANFPGFRKGKVPLSMIRTRYGNQAQSEAVKTVLDQGANKAVKDNKLRLANRPSVDITSYDEGKDLTASLTCEILPEIKIPNLAKLSIERPVIKTDKDQMEAAMQHVARENRLMIETGDDYAAAEGDVVILDVSSDIAGKPTTRGEQKNVALELGANGMPPSFDAGLKGVKKGEAKSINSDFPDDHPDKEVAGKTVTFKVQVNDVRRLGEAKFDAELAKRLKFDSVSKLREAVENSVNQEHAPAVRHALKRNVLDALDSGHSFEIPPSMMETEYEGVARALRDRGNDAGGDTGAPAAVDDAEPADAGMSDDLKVEARRMAERRVRLGLLLGEIGHEHNIDVSEQDMHHRLVQECRKYPGQEEDVMAYFRKTPSATEQMRSEIFENKTIDYVLEIATVKDVVVGLDALYASLRDEVEDAKAASAKKSK